MVLLTAFLLHGLNNPCLASTSSCPQPPDHQGSERKGLSQRAFLKGMRHEINLYGGVIATDLMGTSYLTGISYAFHFNEDFALEMGFAYTRISSSLSKSVQDFTGYSFLKEHDARIYTGNLTWHPFHGKFMFFNTNVLHFDFYLLGGVGTTDSHYDKGLTYNAGAGIKIFCNSWLSIRVEIRDHIHVQQVLSSEVISNDVCLTAGVGFWFPFTSKEQLEL